MSPVTVFYCENKIENVKIGLKGIENRLQALYYIYISTSANYVLM